VKLLKFTLILILLGITAAGYCYNIDGTLSTAYEVSKDKGESSEGLWENFLSIDNAKLLDPYIGFNFYGRYSQEDGDSYTDIYSAYLDYSSFQKSVEVKLGRFSYVGNRFLTLDGAEATVRTDYLFGATVFAGSPEYYDSDERHINETFRDTGDRLYGGKIFLNGLPETSGYISYSKEEYKSEDLQEMLGLGLGRRFVLSDQKFVNLNGKLEYDTDESTIYKGTARIYVKADKLSVIADFNRYNVKDGSSYENELVISNFSSGRENRYGLTVEYALTDSYIPYAGLVHTELEMPSGAVAEGDISKMGLDVDYFKTHGLSANIEGYHYSSEISNANGGSVALDWNITREFRLRAETEMLRLENAKTRQNIYSMYFEAAYDVLKDLTIQGYAENNRETRYLPENRVGIKAEYSF